MLIQFNGQYLGKASHTDLSATYPMKMSLNGEAVFEDVDILRSLWKAQFDRFNSLNEIKFEVEYYFDTICESEINWLSFWTRSRQANSGIGIVKFICGGAGETASVYQSLNATVRGIQVPSYSGKSFVVQWTIKCQDINWLSGAIVVGGYMNTVQLQYPGTLEVTSQSFGGWKPDVAAKIRIVELEVFDPAVGSDIIVQLKDSLGNNVGAPCTLAAGSLSQQTAQTNLVVPAGTTIQGSITQVGSTNAGQQLTIRLFIAQ